MKLHHRVTVKASRFLGRRLWHWSCPACSMVSLAESRLRAIQTSAEHHAIGCVKLYRWNRETAWPCRCNHGLIDGVECPICLGKGFSA